MYIYSLPLIICPNIFCHHHFIAMVFHVQKFNFQFNFTLFYLPPSLFANIFTSSKGGG